MTALKLMIDPIGGAINYIQANVNNIIESLVVLILVKQTI